VPGYPPEHLLLKPSFVEANIEALDRIAQATEGLTAVVGYVDRDDDIYNAAARSRPASRHDRRTTWIEMRS
jgi:NAD+ synthase (glutamine-hydrolysing)